MITLTSTELNYLIYRYLLEEGYHHSAYVFGRESMLEDNTEVPQILHDAIKKYVTRGVEMEYIEMHTDENNRIKKCTSKYSISTPHKCIETALEASPIYLKSQESDVSLCAWSSTGELVTGSRSCNLSLWMLPQKQAQNQWKLGVNEGFSHGITGISVESNSFFTKQQVSSTVIAAATNSGDIFVSDRQLEWRVLKAHKGPVVAVSLKGSNLLTGGWDGICKRWEIHKQSLVEVERWNLHNGAVMDIIPFDSGFATCSVDGSICCVDKDKGIMVLRGHSGEVNALKRAENVLVSCSDDSTVKLWNYNTPDAICTLEAHKKEVYTIDTNSKYVVSGSFDSNVCLWDIERQSLLSILEGHKKPIYSVAFSFDGSLIASAGLDYVVNIWDTRSYEIAKEFNVGSGVYQVQFSPSGSMLAVCSSNPHPLILELRR